MRLSVQYSPWEPASSDPILIGIPERSGLEQDHLPPAPGQALGNGGAAGAGANDREVNLVAVAIADHSLTRHSPPVDIEQEG